MTNKRIVIYTCITGGYDRLIQFPVIDQNFDYICFSDSLPDGERIGQWVVRSVPNLGDISSVRVARYVKTMPHKMLADYDFSVWVDANVEFTSPESYQLIHKLIGRGETFGVLTHLWRDCIYDEAIEVIKAGLDSWQTVTLEVAFMRLKGMPRHYGLYESNMLLREHNNPEVVAADELWWDMLCRFSHRDQLSQSYALWKSSLRPTLMLSDKVNTRNSELFRYIEHEHSSEKASGKTRFKELNRKHRRATNIVFRLLGLPGVRF